MYTDDLIDIEKPEHLSKQHTIYVYSMFIAEESSTLDGVLSSHVTIPVHLRYHKPNTDGTLVRVAYLGPPTPYIHCSGE